MGRPLVLGAVTVARPAAAGSGAPRRGRPPRYCLYLTEQPYGLVRAVETGLPAVNSASACST